MLPLFSVHQSLRGSTMMPPDFEHLPEAMDANESLRVHRVLHQPECQGPDRRARGHPRGSRRTGLSGGRGQRAVEVSQERGGGSHRKMIAHCFFCGAWYRDLNSCFQGGVHMERRGTSLLLLQRVHAWLLFRIGHPPSFFRGGGGVSGFPDPPRVGGCRPELEKKGNPPRPPEAPWRRVPSGAPRDDAPRAAEPYELP